MTRDELKALGVPEEMLGGILDLNSRDIGKTKGKSDDLKTENDSLKQQIEENKTTIANLEAAKTDLGKMQEELERYKEAEKERADAEKAAQLDAILTQTATDAVKERKFVNEVTKNYYIGELKKAISDKNNSGKSAADLFDAMTKDVEGVFSNPQHEPLVIPRADLSGGSGTTYTKEQIRSMTPEQINANWAEVSASLKGMN